MIIWIFITIILCRIIDLLFEIFLPVFETFLSAIFFLYDVSIKLFKLFFNRKQAFHKDSKTKLILSNRTKKKEYNMNYNNIDEIKKAGFEGFLLVEHLMNSSCAEVPEQKGIYFVLYKDKSEPAFLDESVGGHFKKKDPSAVSIK